MNENREIKKSRVDFLIAPTELDFSYPFVYNGLKPVAIDCTAPSVLNRFGDADKLGNLKYFYDPFAAPAEL